MHGLAGIMYGGGDFNRAHKVDEYITVTELLETAKIFMGIVIEKCCVK